MNIVLLLGAPGTGKSTLGHHIARAHGNACEFLSAGEWIREQGLLDAAPKERLRAEAAALLERRLLSANPPNGILILEFVKDVDGAYALMQILAKHSGKAKLSQAVLLTRRTARAIRSLLPCDARSGRRRDAERKVAERTPKWRANAGRLIEFFSSMGVLHALVPCGGRRLVHPLIPAAGSGVLDRFLPRGLLLQRLDWAVSPRLVTDGALVERLAHEAVHAIAGLRSLPVPVPHAMVRTQADVGWVASVPGRYRVSYKCDGTRYALIVTADGRHYFRNRVGFVYAYPVATPLPRRTILDGELVWGAGGGYFLAFDVVVFAGRRVWGLPLGERLDAMRILATDETVAAACRGLHMQRAPSRDALVTVVAKRHFDSLAEAASAYPTFPVDGMVFTPDAVPYVLPHHGLLTYKWQPPGRRACDLRCGDFDLVYECVHCPWTGWQPIAIRWDKATPSSDAERIGSQCLDASLLVGPALCRTAARGDDGVPGFNNKGMRRATLPKEELLRAVESGLVERTVDAGTGLEIFNRTPLGGKSLPCRGTVFDGDRLVAAAFDSFDGDSRPPRGYINASLKFDGTLIIAFVHNCTVRACTRRRMDSEQAVWAQRWLDEHARADAFVEGWTYAFEAVYAANTVIVPYAFEGLVFLDAWSPDGMSTAPSDRPALSSRLGALMCAPSIPCRASELWRLMQGPPLAFEGWVLEEEGGRRAKLVHPSYKAASRLAGDLHPVRVWHAVRMGAGADRATTRMMPAHVRAEQLAILAALERAFNEERDYDAASKGPDDRAATTTTAALSMYYNRSRPPGTLLRVELMDRIRPSDAGEMRYYAPSANFAQTFAKGWKLGPAFAPPPPIVSALGSTGVMDHIFRGLPMPAVGNALLVCRSWHQAITKDAGFDARVAAYVAARTDRGGRWAVCVGGVSSEDSDEEDISMVRSDDDDDGYGSY